MRPKGTTRDVFSHVVRRRRMNVERIGSRAEREMVQGGNDEGELDGCQAEKSKRLAAHARMIQSDQRQNRGACRGSLFSSCSRESNGGTLTFPIVIAIQKADFKFKSKRSYGSTVLGYQLTSDFGTLAP